MQKYLLKEGVDEYRLEKNTRGIDKSIEYIRYIACMQRNKRNRVIFERAKSICSEEIK